MRAVVVIALVAGCFNPKTNGKCQYQCASSGTACPSGLSCVAGMCVAPGETCGTGDGGTDTGDSRVAACGDGFHDPGEVCYGTPIQIIGTDVTYDGQLADVDGDGDLDLIYLIGDQYVYHLYDQGMLGGARNGPTVFATHMVAFNTDGDPHAELINASTTVELWDFNPAASAYSRISNITMPAGQDTVDLVVGSINNQRPGVLVLSTSELQVYGVDGSGGLVSVAAQGNVTGANAVAIGPIDGDMFDDVVTAQMTGIMYRRSTGTTLAAEIALAVPGTVTGVALGDTDGDGKNDVVYTAAPDRLGVIHSQGAGAFATPTTQQVGNVQRKVVAAKIDGDMRADAIALKSGPNAVLVALGKSDGTLAAPIEIPIAVPATYVHADADFNGDSVPDIVVTDFNSQTILILPSNP